MAIERNGLIEVCFQNEKGVDSMHFSKVVRHFTILTAFLLFIVNIVIAGDEDTASKIMTKIHGYASLEGGEIVKGLAFSGAIPVDHAWLHTYYMGIYLDAAISDRLRIIVGGEAQYLIPFRRYELGNNEIYVQNRAPKTVFNIKWGEAQYTFSIGENLHFQLEAGLFPYKYNPEARNLGEVLYRSYCYPASIISEFDKPYAELIGFRFGNSISLGNNVFHHDLMLTTQNDFIPYQDFSLSYLTGFTISGLLNVGAGVVWWDLLHGFAAGAETTTGIGDDPTTPDIPEWGGKYYTFAGTKVMGRISIDPKGFLSQGLSEVFGKEDLKLYGEVTVLGLKNYHGDSVLFNGNMIWRPSFYDTLEQRVSVMFGMNIPAFKLLDVLSLEFEYQNSPYANSIQKPIYELKPLPNVMFAAKEHAKWKWSLYAKRKLLNHVSIIGQVARDHIIPETFEMANTFADVTDVTLRPGDYWWTIKMRFDI